MRNSALIFFLNYLNINFLYYKDTEYRSYLETLGNKQFLNELDTLKNNEKFSLDFSSAFLHWLLRRSIHKDLIELYYALMDENIRKANDYCDAMQRPPSVPWLVLPKNLKGLLDAKPLERMRLKKTSYNDLTYKTTNIEEFACKK